MRTLSERLASIFVCFTLTACDSWPLYETETVKNFHENKSAFEALEAKLLRSKYDTVSLIYGETVEGKREVDGEPVREFLDDGADWTGLFRAASLRRVRRTGESVVFVTFAPVSAGGIDTEITYVHYIGGQTDLKDCEPQYKDLLCGVCRVRIEPEWSVKYMWMPFPILPNEFERFTNGELAEDVYFEMQGAAYEQCQIEGLKAIGYEDE